MSCGGREGSREKEKMSAVIPRGYLTPEGILPRGYRDTFTLLCQWSNTINKQLNYTAQDLPPKAGNIIDLKITDICKHETSSA